MRTRDNKKIRGDVFEEFCVLYLKYARNYTNVWRLEDVPEHILGGLGLKRPDMGIDIVAERKKLNYVLDVSATMYSKGGIDITSEVIVELLLLDAAAKK
jgi:predicted helicase